MTELATQITGSPHETLWQIRGQLSDAHRLLLTVDVNAGEQAHDRAVCLLHKVDRALARLACGPDADSATADQVLRTWADLSGYLQAADAIKDVVESPGASAELLRRAVITTDTALAGIVTDRVTPARIG
jgi:hypothetical protein